MAHTLPDGRTVAVAHDYLTQRGGAERVVLSLARAFPGAPVHTTLHHRNSTYPEIDELDVRVSALDRIGPLQRSYRSALPFLPMAASSLRPTEDVVIASTSGWAHGFRATGEVIAYCHAPARWLYQTEAYLGGSMWSSPKGLALAMMKPSLRSWDRRAAQRPSRYLCNSRVVRDRIREAYDIDAEVVAPPHSMDPDAPREAVAGLADWAEDGYLLVVSRLLPYKNVDVLVEAVRGTPYRLVVVGSGPESARLRDAAPLNVRMLEGLSDTQLRWVYGHARLLLAPSLEDFGLTPLEAAAFGVPALTLRAGGYLDTVVEGTTGMHVDTTDIAAFREAITAASYVDWDADAVRAHAAEFSEQRFAERIRAAVSGQSVPTPAVAPTATTDRPRVETRSPEPTWAEDTSAAVAADSRPVSAREPA